MKRRFFSLLEVLVAFGLAAMIAGLLLTYYRYQAQVAAKIRLSHEELSTRATLYMRLTQIFSTVTSEISELKSGLKFELDNGIDKDPLFSHSVKGKLFVRRGELIFEMRRDGKNVREEILAKNVSSYSHELIDQALLKLMVNGEEYPLFIKKQKLEVP